MNLFNHFPTPIKHILTLLLVLLATSGLRAEELSLDSLYKRYNDCYFSNDTCNERRYISMLLSQSEAQGNVNVQGKARKALLYYYYNQNYDDSLELAFPQCHQFFRSHEQWKSYYDTWVTMANHYLFAGHKNTALRELQQMFKDAQERDNNYGIGIASYGLGNVYMDMGNTEEAAESYERSLRILPTTEEVHIVTLLDIYPYYCSVLADQKEYQTMLQVTDQWRQHLEKNVDKLGVGAGKIEQTIYYTYYYNSRATALIGLKDYDGAERLLNKAYENTRDVADNSQLSIVYNLGQLYCKKGDLVRAKFFNDRLMRFYDQPDDPVGLLLAKRQRAEIQFLSRNYAEAATLYKEVYLLTDSLNQNDIKSQINEFNALFKVDEMEKEQQHARTRNAYIIFGIIIGSLLLVALVGLVLMTRLRQKNRQLAMALDHANESDRMKTAFVQHISHEIRTPLNVVTGFAQVISSPDYHLSAEDRNHMLNEIGRNTREITSFVNELLEFSENESHTHYELSDMVSINSLCSDLMSKAESVNSNGLRLNFETTLDDDFVLCSNEDALRKVLTQMVKNGIKFTEKGSVTLKAEPKNDRSGLVISVTDTGIGIPKELHEKVFEKFYKVDAFKQGLGLGLTMARRIARMLGGNLDLDENYTQGCRFVLTLPCR